MDYELCYVNMSETCSYVNMSKSKMLNRDSAIPTAPNARSPHIHHVYRKTNPLKMSLRQC